MIINTDINSFIFKKFKLSKYESINNLQSILYKFPWTQIILFMFYNNAVKLEEKEKERKIGEIQGEFFLLMSLQFNICNSNRKGFRAAYCDNCLMGEIRFSSLL